MTERYSTTDVSHECYADTMTYIVQAYDVPMTLEWYERMHKGVTVDMVEKDKS